MSMRANAVLASTAADLLRAFSPLESLDDSSLAAIQQRSTRRTVSFGEIICREGEPASKTHYLVSGNVEIARGNAVMGKVRGASAEARYPLSKGSTHRQTVTVMSPTAELLEIDSEILDQLVTWDQTGSYRVVDLSAGAAVDPGDWMTQVLQSKVLQSIPAANIQALFMRMQKLDRRAGETVVKQGENGDCYYIIVRGRCVVRRELPTGGAPIVLAELGVGDSFGEDALLSGSKRSATITMLTDGALMRVSASDFLNLCSQPVLKEVDREQARQLIARGGHWLDVRLPSEVAAEGIPSAIHVPLYLLRMRMDKLPRKGTLVVFCDTGRRSSAAAFILANGGYDVVLLKGGLHAAPELSSR